MNNEKQPIGGGGGGIGLLRVREVGMGMISLTLSLGIFFCQIVRVHDNIFSPITRFFWCDWKAVNIPLPPPQKSTDPSLIDAYSKKDFSNASSMWFIRLLPVRCWSLKIQVCHCF